MTGGPRAVDDDLLGHAHGVAFTGAPLPEVGEGHALLVPDDGATMLRPTCAVERLDGDAAVAARAHGAAPEARFAARDREGHEIVAVERSARGFLVQAPGLGTHWVAPDGGALALGAGGWRAARLLCAQTLPLIATLRGLEPLHAAAVVLDGRALALVAPSGTGKSSIMAALVVAGAAFLTDDVLALDVAQGAVRAHPGPRLAHGAGLGPVVATDDKPWTAAAGATAAVPLGGVAFLQRAPAAGVTPLAPDPTPLLRSTYVAHVDAPERLRRQLDVCATVAATVPLARVAVPRGDHAAAVAHALTTWFVSAGAPELVTPS